MLIHLVQCLCLATHPPVGTAIINLAINFNDLRLHYFKFHDYCSIDYTISFSELGVTAKDQTEELNREREGVPFRICEFESHPSQTNDLQN